MRFMHLERELAEKPVIRPWPAGRACKQVFRSCCKQRHAQATGDPQDLRPVVEEVKEARQLGHSNSSRLCDAVTS